MIAGLTFLAPGAYLLAYVVGGGLALLFWSRQRGLKLAFNLSLFSLEAALGAATYTAIMGTGGDPIAHRAWLAALVAVLVTDLLSAAAVTVAISLTEGRLDQAVMREALAVGDPGGNRERLRGTAVRHPDRGPSRAPCRCSARSSCCSSSATGSTSRWPAGMPGRSSCTRSSRRPVAQPSSRTRSR